MFRKLNLNYVYADLGERQPLPHSDIAHGGAGTAYALWRFDHPSAAWIRAALADPRRLPWATAESYLFGRTGARCVSALVDPRGREAAIRALVRMRAAREVELAAGLAGQLLGLCMLRSHLDDPRIQRKADAFGERLAARVRRHGKRWHRHDTVNFAHGWPGALFALLAWRPADAWLVESLAALAKEWQPGLVIQVPYRGTWCTGDGGVTLLWARAYEHTGDVRFLRIARRAATSAMRWLPERPHLCCGAGGVAYAALALDRIDPGRQWRDRARRIAKRALRTPLTTRWPSGLLWGHPGLACLEQDVAAARGGGFPLIERA